MDQPLPPLPTINNNTVGSVKVAVELFDLDESASAIAVSVTDDFFCSSFSKSGGLQDRFLSEGSPDDNGKKTIESWANISASYHVGVFLDDAAEENKVLALGVSFLVEQLFWENCNHNKKNLNEEG